jgi:hypothetical protein
LGILLSKDVKETLDQWELLVLPELQETPDQWDQSGHQVLQVLMDLSEFKDLLE